MAENHVKKISLAFDSGLRSFSDAPEQKISLTSLIIPAPAQQQSSDAAVITALFDL